jgi:hypothetical protein
MCEQTPPLAQQHLPGVSELHPPAASVKQCHPKLLLESTDLMTQRRLSDVQPLGGPAEVKLLSDGDEVLHKPQVQTFDRRNLMIGADSGSRRRPRNPAGTDRRRLLATGHFVLDFRPLPAHP